MELMYSATKKMFFFVFFVLAKNLRQLSLSHQFSVTFKHTKQKH